MGFRWLKDFFSSKKSLDRIKIAEDMLFGKGSMLIDQQIVDATAKLAEAFCRNNSPGVVDTGVFLFVKVEAEPGRFRIFAKRLSISDRIKLNDQPSLLEMPSILLESLGMKPLSLNAANEVPFTGTQTSSPSKE